MSPAPQPVWAFVALGSNLGQSAALLTQAMNRLETYSAAPLLRSSLWDSEPIDCPPGSPSFLNAVVGLAPLMDETSESLLSKLQAVEREFGRPGRHGRNTPRTLDLDLLTFGLERRESERLILPHPRAHERAFVLAPLNEIAPELILPGQQKTVGELLQDLGGTAARLVHRRH